jgi:phosphatidylglycerophosphate synthase
VNRRSLVNPPNLISLCRLPLAVVFVGLPHAGARVAVLLVAMLTDLLDGWVARRANAVTRAGALIDPIADRLFVLAVVLAYLADGLLSAGQVLVLLARDIMTAVGFGVARNVSWLRPVEFKARWSGKVVTMLQLTTLLLVLVRPSLVPPLVLAIGVAAAVSIADYTLALWRARVR